MTRERGFTLIELMVVIAVVGILMMIAVPAYTEQMRKSRRSEAVRGLGDLVLKQEKWRSNHATYGTCDNLTGTCATYNNATNSPYYTFAVSGNAAAAYTLTATPKTSSVQNGDPCGVYTFSLASGTLSKSAVGGSKCL